MKYGWNFQKNLVSMFQFSIFLKSTFRLSNRTPKITQILTLYQANSPTLTRCNFSNLIIFSTHTLQTFKHNTLINELLLLTQFYIFFPKLHHWKSGSYENYASHCCSLLMLWGDWKRGTGKRGTIKNAGVENAGLENAGPIYKGGKRGTISYGTPKWQV